MSFFDSKEPLGLPKGSVRAIIALALIGALIVGVFTLAPEAIAPLIALAGVVATFYFEQRRNDGA